MTTPILIDCLQNEIIEKLKIVSLNTNFLSLYTFVEFHPSYV